MEESVVAVDSAVGPRSLSVVHPNEPFWVELEAVAEVRVEPSRLSLIHRISMHAMDRIMDGGFSPSLSDEYLNFLVTIDGGIDAQNHSDSSFAIEITFEN